jgi:glycosyltransferase involved in cell wall biosynthesis
LFVLPSVRLRSGRMEGIPVALMEAMASGVPVVASRLSGIPELVEDGVTGLLVPPGDPTALAAAIARLLEDDVLAAELARSARERVERSFSLAGETQRLGDLFAESIIGASAHQPEAGVLCC